MNKKYLKILIWIVVIIYGLFIYPYPESFPTLSGRLVSFLVMVLTVSTFLMDEKK